jgi:hypothetical protein
LSQGASNATAPRVNEWEPPADRTPSVGARVLLIAILVLIAAALVVLSRYGWIAGSIGFALSVVWLVQQGPGVRRSRPADDRDARALSLVRGLSADAGMPAPALRVAPATDTNAAVASGWRGRTIFLTQGALDSYSRTELEAVIAHCMLRLKEAGLEWHLLVGALGGIGSRAAPYVGQGIDARSVALTRYPPALASAIEKAVPKRGRRAGFWLVAMGPTHLAPAERVAALLDL